MSVKKVVYNYLFSRVSPFLALDRILITDITATPFPTSAQLCTIKVLLSMQFDGRYNKYDGGSHCTTKKLTLH